MLRAGWFGSPLADASAVARQCSRDPGVLGPSSYVVRGEAWGITYQVDGVFIAVPNAGVWQLEMIAPVDKARFVAQLFADWIKTVAR